jgi:hypothetical protein
VVQSAIGNVNLNVAPLPSKLFSPQISPPWASTIFLQIYSPNPVPVLESPVVNFENNSDGKGVTFRFTLPIVD